MNTREAFAWFYANGNFPNMVAVSPSTGMAAAVGYGAAAPVDPVMTAMDAAYAKLSRNQQLAVQQQVDGQDLDGNQVSDFGGSCRGEVFTTVYGGLKIDLGLDEAQTATVGAIIGGVNGPAGDAVLAADPAMTQADVSWAACMNTAGITAATTAPAEDLAPPSTKVGGTNRAPVADIATATTLATADATCAQHAGIETAYQAAVYAFLAQHIKGNSAAFTQYFTVHNTQVANAKKYLGIS